MRKFYLNHVGLHANFLFCTLAFMLWSATANSQSQEQFVNAVVQEVDKNSQLESLAHELLDVIGPRLVGSPQMEQAHKWAVDKFESWQISAENQKWGQWKAWERGITHIDMVYPRVRTLEGMQLAWSPSTGKNGVTAELVILPEV